MLDENQQPRPVYEALLFMSTFLSDVSYAGDGPETTGLETHIFSSPEKEIWVIWSPEQVDVPFQIPEGEIRIFDKFGNEIQVEGNDLSINDAVFLELIL